MLRAQDGEGDSPPPPPRVLPSRGFINPLGATSVQIGTHYIGWPSSDERGHRENEARERREAPLPQPQIGAAVIQAPVVKCCASPVLVEASRDIARLCGDSSLP
jgi:hypothetical protein